MTDRFNPGSGPTAYPLWWPAGWPRTALEYRHGRLRGWEHQRWDSVVDRLMTELRRLEAKDPVLSSNQPIRRDGAPYAARRIIHDPGVTVYFVRGGRPLVMAQNRYWRLVDNIRSLALAIEGLRKMQRHGGGIMLERAFAGFAALPAPDARAPWWTILGVSPQASQSEIRAAWKERARQVHPDHGNHPAQLATLNAAYQEALQARA